MSSLRVGTIIPIEGVSGITTFSGDVDFEGIITGNGSGLTNLPAVSDANSLGGVPASGVS